eukprot:Gregarina_sp_Poly_1__3338@NODE_195_length_11596_cov_85_481395_g174_i0_p1_GENE_NODE_195_length_11596_cov_85_481395_g174_i0NODE_195_length_11596_cov_85_481395_g174_i0_p1_ORF_typecomplete_len1544_score255_12Aquarius_N/PF16399_5/7e117AAA_11/PF13086_6/2_9e31AAA_12/PF13087_6/9_7e21AAA_30/PF13604_6/1_3e07AAA_30/PF13604_6/0_00056AAA_19/PF13245_6/2_7e10ResIII/PF04851_15/2_2e05ResIII/PF04851_15/2_3e03UvrDhelicase/PF00580_21/2_3e05Terminase_6/PF03237_15/0_0013Terminase_6/PF03237_15/5_9e02DEAD/PF00270_29/0_
MNLPAPPLEDFRDALRALKDKSVTVQELEAANAYFEKAAWPTLSRQLLEGQGTATERVQIVELCVLLFTYKLQSGIDEELWAIVLKDGVRTFNIFIMAVCDLLISSLEHIANLLTSKVHKPLVPIPVPEMDYLSPEQCSVFVLFFILLTDNIHVPAARQVIFRLFGLAAWRLMSPTVRQEALNRAAGFVPLWEKTNALIIKAEAVIKQEKELRLGEERHEKVYMTYQSQFFLQTWIKSILVIGSSADRLANCLSLTERLLECFCTCLSLLPIRRTLKPVFDSVQLVSRLAFTPIATRCKYFFVRLDEVDSYGLSTRPGGTYSETVIGMRGSVSRQIGKLHRFAVHSEDPAFAKIIATPFSTLANRNSLMSLLGQLSVEALDKILSHLGINTDLASLKLFSNEDSKLVLLQVATHHLTREATWPQRLAHTAVLPNEKDIWEGAELFRGMESTSDPVPMPRLGLQYLNLEDFFLRNFDLYRAEALYGIQQDLEKTIYLMRPEEPKGDGVVQFSGVSKFGIPINSFNIVNIGAPLVGSDEPSEVRGEIAVDLKSIRFEDREDWDALRSGDLVFLVSLGPRQHSLLPLPQHLIDLTTLADFPGTYGLLGVRVCEVKEVLDREGGVVTNLFRKTAPIGTRRTIRVTLDPLQYRKDVEEMGRGELFEGFYESFNLLVRRKPETNNFKGVLQSLRSLALAADSPELAMSEQLHDTLLGFGDINACNPLKSAAASEFVAFNTFVDLEHLKDSVRPHYPEVEVSDDAKRLGAPYQLRFQDEAEASPEEQAQEPLLCYHSGKGRLLVDHWELNDKQRIRFALKPPVLYTRAQVMAIRSGMGEGISLIVGPPGTGKTDTAVQIVNQLMLNYPDERILIIAKTNQALNDFFTKVVQLGIDEKCLLRLGFGERELGEHHEDGTRKEFSKWGRVDHILTKRQILLARFEALFNAMNESSYFAEDLGVATDFLMWALPIRRDGFRSLVREADAKVISTTDSEAKIHALKEALERAQTRSPWFGSCVNAVRILLWLNATNQEKNWVFNGLDSDEDNDELDEKPLNFQQSELQNEHSEHQCSQIKADPKQDPAEINQCQTSEMDDGQPELEDIRNDSAVETHAVSALHEAKKKDQMMEAVVHEFIQDDSMHEAASRIDEIAGTEAGDEPDVAPSAKLIQQQLSALSSSVRADLQLAQNQTMDTELDKKKEELLREREIASNNKKARLEAIRARISLLDDGRRLMNSIVNGEAKSTAFLFFPFQGFQFRAFAEKSLVECENLEEAEYLVSECYEELNEMISAAIEMRPFELLRSVADRTEYMITNFSRIVAMTSTHAALSRESLILSGFQYSTLIVEEAAQILDVETVLTTLLQRRPLLKRIVMLGDHLQLKPVIQNRGLERTCNFDLSLFSRLIRLGTPYIQLDAQGRCRSRLADLFRWRYRFPPLRDLPLISEGREFLLANPGLAFNFQFVDVPHGEERCLSPHYYQNEAEAGLIVALFSYMRLIGYPAHKISILTFYNGQKDLLRKMVKDRCQWNPLIGLPSKITTVDKFQGQQNDCE